MPYPFKRAKIKNIFHKQGNNARFHLQISVSWYSRTLVLFCCFITIFFTTHLFLLFFSPPFRLFETSRCSEIAKARNTYKKKNGALHALWSRNHVAAWLGKMMGRPSPPAQGSQRRGSALASEVLGEGFQPWRIGLPRWAHRIVLRWEHLCRLSSYKWLRLYRLV